ncbi:MAG: 3-phosphoshikimate 1-carboxyvinyltransferase [Deltaproteobacteria bacterium]|nr:3-phosphoshikimate 1-carboxyvinyltransferase [Deltaproteobacteria bacterium]
MSGAGRLPAELAIRPRGPLDATVRVPGSKSITNRAAVCAALAAGESTLAGALASDDTDAMRVALGALGVPITVAGDAWHVSGRGGRLAAPAAPLDARASGTTARFLTAAATLAEGPVVIDGAPRMRERPIDDLAAALVALGAAVEILGPGGCPPVRVAGGGLAGGRAAIDARRSSQFVTAVLLAAPYARRDVELAPVEGVVVSRPYVDLTLQVMGAFGARAGWAPDGRALRVAAGRPYQACRFAIEPDASAAAYPFAAAAIAGGEVRVPGVPADSLQADFRLLGILERMGCTVTRQGDAVAVRGPAGPLRAVDADMNELPDAVLALAVVALFAEGTTRIRNVANLRIKETDRLAALEAELAKLGARATAGPDWLTIEPGPLHGAAIDTYDDHRMAMSFALAGLRVPGVVIRDPGCVAKTWPDYFDALARL